MSPLASASVYRAPRLIAIFVLALPWGCAGYQRVATETTTQVSTEAGRVGTIKKELEAVRGLSFNRQFGIEARRKNAIRQRLETALVKEYGERRLENLALVYARLGLLPPGSDLKSLLLDFYAPRALGYYDPAGKNLVLRADIGSSFVPTSVRVIARLDNANERVLVHELTHVLQDQHFSLDGMGAAYNDDRVLAFHSILEGDATLAEFGFRWGGLDGEMVPLINRRLLAGVQKARAQATGGPRFLVDRLLFQYYSGTTFVSLLLADKGWSGIDRLYTSPPLSTEQVLHPEKYLDWPDPPTRVEFAGLEPLSREGWPAVESNSLGELMVQCLFAEFLVAAEAENAALGWDGDRYWAFRNGSEISLLWVTVWDSIDDAEEFVNKYGQVAVKKYGSMDAAAANFYFERRDNVVMMVEGPGSDEAAGRFPLLWRRLKLTEEPFHPLS